MNAGTDRATGTQHTGAKTTRVSVKPRLGRQIWLEAPLSLCHQARKPLVQSPWTTFMNMAMHNLRHRSWSSKLRNSPGRLRAPLMSSFPKWENCGWRNRYFVPDHWSHRLNLNFQAVLVKAPLVCFPKSSERTMGELHMGLSPCP